MLQDRALAIQRRFSGQRKPEVGRISTHLVSEEARGRNADDGIRDSVNCEGGPDHRRIAPVVLLPGAVAHHCCRRSLRLVVFWRHHAPCEGTEAEGGEVIARHEFTIEWFRRPGRTASAHAEIA